MQAQAARDQAGRGGLLPKGEQKAADEGLLGRPEREGRTLWRGARANIVPTGTDDRMPLTTIPGQHEVGTEEDSAGRQSESDIGGPRPANRRRADAA